MQKGKGMFAGILCALLLAACGGPAQPPEAGSGPAQAQEAASAPQAEARPLALGEVLDMVNERHRAIQKPVIDFTEYIHEASGDAFNIFEYGEEAPFDPAAPLTAEQARQDLDVLFRALETTYGPYYAFGGDEAFGQAKAKILADVEGRAALTAESFAGSILEHLAFLRDGHFTVNGQRLSDTVAPYLYTGTAFLKTEAGFQAAGGKLVESVDGYGDLEELFRLSLSGEGEAVWYPVVLAELSAQPGDLTVRYTDGTTETLSTAPWKSDYDESERLVELHENQGIPVLFVRNMGFDEAKGDEMGAAFLSYAEKLRDEPVLIVDLRSNGGGNSLLPLKWFQAYAGQFVPTNCQGLQYWSEADMLEYCKNTENQFYVSYETMTGLGGETPVSDAYMKQFAHLDDFVKNDRLLIILTAKNTASAAETFTDIAHNLENTLIIGQNTYGMLTSNAYMVMYLPNSKAAVQLGNSLTLFPEGSFEEFKGFQPDLWVSGDAEEAAVRFVKRAAP